MHGWQLRARRRDVGVTQVALAKLLRVTNGTVSMWEKGKRPILGVTQVAIDAVLGQLERGEIVIDPAMVELKARKRSWLAAWVRAWVNSHL